MVFIINMKSLFKTKCLKLVGSGIFVRGPFTTIMTPRNLSRIEWLGIKPQNFDFVDLPPFPAILDSFFKVKGV